MEKCINCNSEKIEIISSKFAIIKNYTKAITNSHTENGSISIPIQKHACLDCGHVFESISPSDLTKYKELEPYFTR